MKNQVVATGAGMTRHPNTYLFTFRDESGIGIQVSRVTNSPVPTELNPEYDLSINGEKSRQ